MFAFVTSCRHYAHLCTLCKSCQLMYTVSDIMFAREAKNSHLWYLWFTNVNAQKLSATSAVNFRNPTTEEKHFTEYWTATHTIQDCSTPKPMLTLSFIGYWCE